MRSIMDQKDVAVLLDPTTSVEGLQNYFRTMPTPTRRELATIKRLVGHIRYRDITDPGAFLALHPLNSSPPTR